MLVNQRIYQYFQNNNNKNNKPENRNLQMSWWNSQARNAEQEHDIEGTHRQCAYI